MIWAFPLYWAVVTTFKPEDEVVRPYIELWPDTFTFEAYVHIIKNTKIVSWYINSIIVFDPRSPCWSYSWARACGYAISQLRFPGRSLLWGMILASFMVPIQALIVNHFVIMSDVGLLNTLPGIILPQLIHPVVVIVYKQFFDSVPRDFREAAIMDGANDFHLLFRIYLPMNWGVTAALAIITFITRVECVPLAVPRDNDRRHDDRSPSASPRCRTHSASTTRGLLAGAVLAGLPVALIYLIFQRRVTQAITLSAGIKG